MKRGEEACEEACEEEEEEEANVVTLVALAVRFPQSVQSVPLLHAV